MHMKINTVFGMQRPQQSQPNDEDLVPTSGGNLASASHLEL